MTAEPIARVINDLHHGRIRHLLADQVVNRVAAERAQATTTVVDATPIYSSLVAKDRPVDLYGDHPCIAPPWDHAFICYVNEHGNVVAMQLTAEPWPPGLRWDTPNTIAWDELRWRLDALVWIGGRSQGADFPTTGPVHLMQYAVMPDGAPADLHYARLVPQYPRSEEHTSELQSRPHLVCRLLLEKKKNLTYTMVILKVPNEFGTWIL